MKKLIGLLVIVGIGWALWPTAEPVREPEPPSEVAAPATPVARVTEAEPERPAPVAAVAPKARPVEPAAPAPANEPPPPSPARTRKRVADAMRQLKPKQMEKLFALRQLRESNFLRHDLQLSDYEVEVFQQIQRENQSVMRDAALGRVEPARVTEVVKETESRLGDLVGAEKVRRFQEFKQKEADRLEEQARSIASEGEPEVSGPGISGP